MTLHVRGCAGFWLAVFSLSADCLARDLTFEERLRAQERTEQVYYSHQIGVRRPFEETVPRPVLEEKVRTYLEESLALEKLWHSPITPSMLQAELERMARGTRSPGRLRELFAALWDDPFLAQECLARPALADRLTRNFFAFDQRLHGPERLQAEALHDALAAGSLNPRGEHSNRTVEEWTVLDPVHGIDRDRRRSDGGERCGPGPRRLTMSSEEFHRRSARLPIRAGEAGAVEEERERFVVRVALEREVAFVRLATYVIPKRSWDDWWRSVRKEFASKSLRRPATGEPSLSLSWPGAAADGAIGTQPFDLARGARATDTPACPGDDQWINGTLDDMPEPRVRHAVAWTGSLLLVWGGIGDQALDTGGRYDPATDTWTPMSRVGAPTARHDAAAVWTGDTLAVWGGLNADLGCCAYYRTGGRYNPATDSWTSTSTVNAPEERAFASAVWTGTEMIVWGGYDFATLNSGGRYNPSTDSWTPISTTNAPAGRMEHTAVWTGSRMVVWGGIQSANTGGVYDPASDTWIPTSTSGAPSGRVRHTAVWTGNEMIIWGGETLAGFSNSGGRYDVSKDAWKATSLPGAPDAREFHVAAWGGGRMIVWGGEADPFTPLGTGGLYDPVEDAWSPTSLADAPAPRSQPSSIWTGSLMIVWGGRGTTVGSQSVLFNSGGRYDPTSNSWTPTSTGSGPSPRASYGLVWTGSQAVLWGGYDGVGILGTGSRYNPALDTWTATSMVNTPSERNAHSAVWTGDRMLVWGGYGSDFLNTGGRYDPVADSWSPMSATGAPSARYVHSAIWSGNRMVVWGGSEDAVMATNTGGRYDPSSDTWSPTSLSGAPSGRFDFSTVWSGSRMIVWGGRNDTVPEFDTGGRYDPVADTWSPTSTTGAPTPRDSHTAVWTASRMLVWGGYDGLGTTGGGLYDPTSDAWTAISTTGAPSSRWNHVAVWTGDRMVAWGGEAFELLENLSRFLDTGGRYDPTSNSWQALPALGAPSRRTTAMGVWTGESVFVWGGFSGGFLGTGGLYRVNLPKAFYQDSDADGFGDPGVTTSACAAPQGFVANAGDCADSDGTVWSAPTEAQSLHWTDAVTLAWSAPVSPGTTQLLYDALRSIAPSNFTSSAICVASDQPNTSLTDLSIPSLQQVLHYLVRAQNGCPDGSGPLGTASNGELRTGLNCP